MERKLDIEKINHALATGQIVEFHMTTVNCRPGNVIMRLKRKEGGDLVEEFQIPTSRSVKPDASTRTFNKMMSTLEQG